MSDAVDSLVLEKLRKIRAEQSVTNERINEVFMRLSSIETGISRISRDESENYR